MFFVIFLEPLMAGSPIIRHVLAKKSKPYKVNCIIAQLLPKKRLFEVKPVKITSKNFLGPHFDCQAVDLGV